MIIAIDVKYFEDNTALAAGVVFEKFTDPVTVAQYRRKINRVEEYIPGSFYKRELPCIMALLQGVKEKIDTIVIDGYVDLGDKPGLGAHLKTEVDPDITVIGVAKSYFKEANAVEVMRGKSANPLYVTANGISSEQAAIHIREMSGDHRIPKLLKLVDSLTRS